MTYKHTSSQRGNDASGSSLLSELAGEASSKLHGIKSATQERQDRDQRLHAALNRIFQFFHPFSGHVNNIAPTLPRTYAIDTQTAYTSLKWLDAHTDSRKQALSDVALLDHVSFHVRLLAPEPVVVTRRWNQLDTLKKELGNFSLRAGRSGHAAAQQIATGDFSRASGARFLREDQIPGKLRRRTDPHAMQQP